MCDSAGLDMPVGPTSATLEQCLRSRVSQKACIAELCAHNDSYAPAGLLSQRHIHGFGAEIHARAYEAAYHWKPKGSHGSRLLCCSKPMPDLHTIIHV